MQIENIHDFFVSEEFILDKQIYSRFMSNGVRFYIVNDMPLPSITSIIHKYNPMSDILLKWYCKHGYEKANELVRDAAVYGTFLHILFEDILIGRQINLDAFSLYTFFRSKKIIDYDKISIDIFFDEWHPKIKQDVLGFLYWIKDYNVKPIAIETTLANKNFAGTIDLVTELTINNKTIKAIIDFKSGRHDFYDDNVMQLQACLELWNYNYSICKIEEIYNYAPKNYMIPIKKSVIPYNFKRHTDKKATRKRWKYLLSSFISDPENYKFRKIFKIDEIIIDKNTDISNIIVEE